MDVIAYPFEFEGRQKEFLEVLNQSCSYFGGQFSADQCDTFAL